VAKKRVESWKSAGEIEFGSGRKVERVGCGEFEWRVE
jgi:hypothetical protein